MQGDDRRAAKSAYKERKRAAGIYALRCAATGELWVGRSEDMPAAETRLRFELRLGSSRNTNLQARWNAHGDASFRFEELERLDEEETPYLRQAQLKDRWEAWLDRLGALPI